MPYAAWKEPLFVCTRRETMLMLKIWTGCTKPNFLKPQGLISDMQQESVVKTVMESFWSIFCFFFLASEERK